MGVHGRAVKAGNQAAPGCSMCHGDVHETASAKTEAFRKAVPETCGMCHDNRIAWGPERCDLCHSGKPGVPGGIYGGNDSDDIIGGHNVAAGHDADDRIDGGSDLAGGATNIT